MDLEEIRNLKKKLNMTNADIAKESGIPLGTVNKILSGKTESPRKETVNALYQMFMRFSLHQESEVDFSYKDSENRNQISESENIYFSGGTSAKKRASDAFTINDYYALPAEKRVELISGRFYDMAAPSLKHQTILLETSFLIRDFIGKRKGNCRVFVAPIDVLLNPVEQDTILQPDLFIVCEKEKCQEHRIEGAPDFIMEIVSPSSASNDYIRKTEKYYEAGVREYWIVDPVRNAVVVYRLSENYVPVFHSFSESIGVGIYEEKLKLCFKKMLE